MKIRGSKTMSLFRLGSLIFQKKKKYWTLKKKGKDYGKIVVRADEETYLDKET